MPRADFPLVWSPSSEHDLVEIWDWGAARFSPETADSHLRDIMRSAHALQEAPHMGRPREELRPGLRSVVIYPSVLFYRLARGTVEIVRVVDGRRNIAAIFAEGD